MLLDIISLPRSYSVVPNKHTLCVYLPYARHHKPLLIRNKEMVFENGVKNIQAAAYNGARMVSIVQKVDE